MKIKDVMTFAKLYPMILKESFMFFMGFPQTPDLVSVKDIQKSYRKTLSQSTKANIAKLSEQYQKELNEKVKEVKSPQEISKIRSELETEYFHEWSKAYRNLTESATLTEVTLQGKYNKKYILAIKNFDTVYPIVEKEFSSKELFVSQVDPAFELILTTFPFLFFGLPLILLSNSFYVFMEKFIWKMKRENYKLYSFLIKSSLLKKDSSSLKEAFLNLEKDEGYAK